MSTQRLLVRINRRQGGGPMDGDVLIYVSMVGGLLLVCLGIGYYRFKNDMFKVEDD